MHNLVKTGLVKKWAAARQRSLKHNEWDMTCLSV